MRSTDKFKNTTGRSTPSQARSKERVRIILAAALELFGERGLERVTTNDIAERAGIPIGSLYRYFPNKDSIITALAELYATDISSIFEQVGKHPLLEHLSWEEVLLMMVDGWVHYVRLNGSFAFLYAIRANPRLYDQNRQTWDALGQNFGKVIKQRCPAIPDKDISLCFRFCMAAAEMGINREQYEKIGPQPHYEAVSLIAAHMLRVCNAYGQHADIMLA